MVISDGLIQIQDNRYVRVQIGKIEPNVYDMRVWDTSGALMWSASGITAAAIKSAIIVDDMVAPNANISASKINIASLVTAINENGNIVTRSSNITVDAEGQTLSSWFSTMESWKDSQSSATSQIQTQLTQINGQISTFVSQSDLTTISNEVQTLSENYSSLSQTINGFSATINAHSNRLTQIESDVSGTASTVNSYNTRLTNIEATSEGLSTTVQNLSNDMSSVQDIASAIDNQAYIDREAFNRAMTEFSQAEDEIAIRVSQAVLEDNSILADINTWFTFSMNGLTIGSSTNNIKLVLTNNKIEFIRTSGGTETTLGVWDGENFTTKNIVIEESMSLNFGGYEILKDSDGCLVIRSTD
jgi:archaellum component FlaC